MPVGSTQDSPVVLPEIGTEDAVQPLWNVIVLNDPVNLIHYVAFVFGKVFGYDKSKAMRHTMEVHEAGRSILWNGDFEKAEAYVYILQNWQLTATLESSDSQGG